MIGILSHILPPKKPPITPPKPKASRQKPIFNLELLYSGRRCRIVELVTPRLIPSIKIHPIMYFITG